MTDAVTLTATAPAVPQPISANQAATMLAEQRAAKAGKTDLSAHASALGKAAAEARKARTTEAQPEPEAGENEQDDEAQGNPEGETLSDDTASSEQSNATTETDGEPQDDGTIDLGDGVKVEKELVREGLMLKADYTRKTQALAEERKGFEADRTQRLTILDNLIGVAQAQLGRPKTMKQWLSEDPVDGMMKFAEQQERLEQFGQLLQTRQQEQAHNTSMLKRSAIKGLETDFGDKAESVFSEAVQYVASKTGTDASILEAMLAHPEAVKMVRDAKAYRELKAKEGDVKRTIADKPKVVKPGAKVSAQSMNHTAASNAHAKLKSSGSLADAIALLQAKRKAGG